MSCKEMIRVAKKKHSSIYIPDKPIMYIEATIYNPHFHTNLK